MKSTVDILREINTATKYPSIPTYHTIDQGILRENEVIEYPQGEPVIGTEKIDGTNARIIFLSNGEYLIGSREELLYAAGDICHNPAQGIVDALASTADYLSEILDFQDVLVVYGEVFGGKIGGQWKNYTTDPKQVSFRIFDIAEFNQGIFNLPVETISAARERNEIQEWYNEELLQSFSEDTEYPLTPRLFTVNEQLPTSLEDMQTFLNITLPETRVRLSDNAQGRSEGVVFRTPDRRIISKARFQDYSKTLRKMNRESVAR